MKILKHIFRMLGIPLSPHKTVGPTTILEYLGLYLDSVKMEARLPENKLERIREIINSFSNCNSCTNRELLSLLGHLNFACRVILPGRSFISYLIGLSTTVKELHHHVKLTAECRLDLHMWSKFLNDNITAAADIQLYTDSTQTAFGGVYKNHWFQGSFPPTVLEENVSMAFFELYPIVMACVLWGHTWTHQRIL